jgi:hypothetical protein
MSERETSTNYSVSDRPVVSGKDKPTSAPNAEFTELPRSYGEPMIFAIARDPRTLFVYWDLDWPSIFAAGEPHARKVFLRIHDSDEGQEKEIEVEPMTGSCTVSVARPRATYHAELGYFHPENVWNSVATTLDVIMPPDAIAEESEIDVVSVPFHLSFQRIIDAFRGSKSDGEALTELVSRLQKRTTHDEASEPRNAAESELLSAIEPNISEMLSWTNAGGASLEKRLQKILGFGSTSPAHGFGGSSGSAS